MLYIVKIKVDFMHNLSFLSFKCGDHEDSKKFMKTDVIYSRD